MHFHLKRTISLALNLVILGSSMPSLGSSNLEIGTHSLSKTETPVQEFAALAQRFAFVSYGLVSKTVKNKVENASISKKEQAIVNKVETSYPDAIHATRSLLYSGKEQEAVQFFGDYVLGLCTTFGLRTMYFRHLPEHIDTTLPVEGQVALVGKAVDLLEKKFNAINPHGPLRTRLKNALFYNFISTKVAPKLLTWGAGPTLALLYGTYVMAKYVYSIEQHQHKMALYNYEEVEHDQKVTYIQTPNIIERSITGAKPKTITEAPCSTPFKNNICNKPADNGNNSGIFNGISHCRGSEECGKCYRYTGLKPLIKIAPETIWGSRPLALIPAFSMLGGFVEEAQLPEYQRRIKEKEKVEQEKKIQKEMRLLKVNYEKNIGFDQIKGQYDLIEREMRMLVDYLRNPLRYHNSVSGTKSVLLYGPPGTGKTLMARAVAKESGAPFIEISADEMFAENSKEKILATIRMAEDIASKRPEKSAIIYIDEIDAVTGNRQDGALDPQRSKALSNLLAIFDGIEKRNPYVHILIVITTNHYKNLDPALLRPGRIDRKILITQPNAEGRREFFEQFLPEEQKKHMDWLIAETVGYSGAQIVNVIDTAQMIASYNNRIIPGEQDYRAAVQNSKVEQEAIPESAKEC